jgi:hypothetical protein
MKIVNKVSDWILILMIAISASPVFASLPVPPSSDMPDSKQSWTDIGQTQIYKMLSVAAVALGAVILIGVAGGTLKAYNIAHEKGDLGHFFKMLFVGLLMAALGLGLCYGGYSIVKS